MNLALREAARAAEEGEVPVGAVCVVAGELIASDHNRSVQRNDPTAHAEVLVLRQAGERLGNYRLNGAHLYVTIEPCAMCVGATLWARIQRLIYGAPDAKAGAVGSRVELAKPGLFNHTLEIVDGVLEEPCRRIMQEFFASRRRE